jgi:hypothetical protein
MQPEQPKQKYDSEPSTHAVVEAAIARSKDDVPWERTSRCQDPGEPSARSKRSRPGNR